MNTRQQIAHLLRRFGLGASRWELDVLTPMGVEGALRHLVETALAGEDDADVLEFMYRDGEDADVGSHRVSVYWSYLLLTSNRPLQEKLAIFWHDHFAVNVGDMDGIMAAQYLKTLRENATAPFPLLLDRIVKEPAMLHYLDLPLSAKGNPNENLGRELLELFTLGEGNFTEQDVDAASDALTGWGHHNFYWGHGETHNERLAHLRNTGHPGSAYYWMPAMHDATPKELLGETRSWNGDEMLEWLATHPLTARHLCRKMWEYFAYENPEEALVEDLAEGFVASGGDIKALIYAIAEREEFWSERCLRKRVKSPVDFTLGICRAQNLGEDLKRLRAENEPGPTKPVTKALWDLAGGFTWHNQQMGMHLLYPPDVAGWNWGEGWVSSYNILRRTKFTGMAQWVNNGTEEEPKWEPGPPLQRMHTAMKSMNPTTPQEYVMCMCDLYDVDLSEGSKREFADFAREQQAVDALSDPGWFGGTHTEMLKLLTATPEYQML